MLLLLDLHASYGLASTAKQGTYYCCNWGVVAFIAVAIASEAALLSSMDCRETRKLHPPNSKHMVGTHTYFF